MDSSQSADTSPGSDSLAGFGGFASAAVTTELRKLERTLQRTLPSAYLQCTTLPIPLSTPLQLALINADFDTGPLPAEVMQAVIAQPAYWAFCWGSGLALAQHLLETPALVAGRRVLDFGAGSGVAGIAAARAGAAAVIACDNDPDALLATGTNAALNQVEIALTDHLDGLSGSIDLVLVADVLYDQANLPLLHKLEALGATLLIADSRITSLRAWGYRAFAERQALTMPNLGEFDEFRRVRFFAREGVSG